LLFIPNKIYFNYFLEKASHKLGIIIDGDKYKSAG